jgi:hypothetical protein
MAYSESWPSGRPLSRVAAQAGATDDRGPGGPLPALASAVLLGVAAAGLVLVSGGGFLGAALAYTGAGALGLTAPVLWFALRNPV